jgi:ubiquinone/menaquinone biosynthesis C-methylase UbiE
MTDHDSQALPTGESWDTYWRGAVHGAAYTSGGVKHPTIQSFWDEFFRSAKAKSDAPKIIDIASGSGPVVESAMRAFAGQLPDFTCLDISASAIRILEQRFPTVHTIVADARQIPLESAGFDIVSSQFGSEYAGLEAIDEIARLVAPGGQLALLLHKRSSSIYRECAASLDAIERIQQAKFVPYAIAMFEKGFAACRGADRTEYEAAAKQLAPAVVALESIITQHGTHVAGDLVTRLYDDVATIHEQMPQYEPSEVLNWLNRMEVELQAFAGRMASMRDAAIDSNTFERLCEGLRRQAFTTIRAEALAEPDQPLALAWALIAIRS